MQAAFRLRWREKPERLPKALHGNAQRPATSHGSLDVFLVKISGHHCRHQVTVLQYNGHRVPPVLLPGRGNGKLLHMASK